ncbi:MAG: AraC family transcriptional regulator [Chloroflexia bacterium]|nr:AraC family transcriptional regulator [Chloroflexia bacterium]
MSRFPNIVDPLGEALHFLRMSGTFYSRCEFAAPWSLVVPPIEDSLIFHVVTAGRCWLVVEGAPPRLMRPGDLTLIPHGDGHRLASGLDVPSVGLFDLPRAFANDRYDLLQIDGGGEAVSLVCAVIHFDHPAARQLVTLLPRAIHVDEASSLERDWMHSTLRFMAAEARHLRPGGESVITRLADVLVIQAIRWWIERDPAARTGWLGALRDDQIGRALTLIHHDPARDWSVAGLADAVAMSRSAFAARFAELVGESPMHYVTRWRMNVAARLLREPGALVGEVADRVGYGSEAAFSRAFKRIIGESPGSVRRQGLAEPVSTGW